ncbi:hypothetical protein SAMD00019534_114350 [Acytostelium subglobosum LB1]|uniref:hypothetical protein n=1 Tax=Acytostelium subglobosum LB1 TaxID=1410327 RepID=UPI000644FE5C|nr:hypothetical protein SAMD00019534_114350 [Acytostelium subglobosum LB1]GAM28259.1 hypothetical protein SAMD00019534_114350 [Acytostelium subglobosum LB1]|eukprot:XP_012748893.1 hypothetical protein SAMD00019534_114350 [Acytostelium subglobosum LB1]
MSLDCCLRPNDDPNGLSIDGTGNPYPCLVILTGKSQSLQQLHENCQTFFGRTTTIRMVIGIKIYKKTTEQPHPFTLLVLLYLRGANRQVVQLAPLNQGEVGLLPLMEVHGSERPTAIVSCGTAPPDPQTVTTITNVLQTPDIEWRGLGHGADPECNGPGLPLYQLYIPVAELYEGATIGAVVNGPPFMPPANLMGVNPGTVVNNGFISVDLHSVQQAVHSKLH